MRDYEAMFIFSPNMSEEKLDKEIKHVEKVLNTHGNNDVKFTNLGKRTLAYQVSKCNEGVYVDYLFTAEPAAITKIKEALKHREDILRSLVILKGR